MKANKYFFPVMGFFSGVVIGMSMIALFAFTSSPSSSAPGSSISAITADVAHSLLVKYLADAPPANMVIKGFTIDKSQLDAMNLISKENAELAGFRIYLGKDAAARKVGIVVGVDNLGNDAVKNTIYSTDLQRTSPCPPICDVSSPIVMDK
jgi:hypothetical protein